ncbi:MAG: hypothetical protein M1822_007958 [Bathelium mastoideum]|nr:MAG: hypothetical protein M1822_007958 [Bathelium mastoideum]
MHFVDCLGRPSLRLTFSYLLDWVVIIAAAGIGAAFNSIEPYKRPFSLLDLNLAFPFAPSTVSGTTLVLVAVLAPALLILLFTLLLVPGPVVTRHRLSRAQIWRRKLWEWHAGWLGLGLSLATTYFITQAMKNLFGVPRPHMLAVCQPDLSNVDQHAVGGFGQDLSARWTLVSASICQTTDASQLRDSFRSFPSGHASTSWAGLGYLSLWLAAKCGVRLPAPLLPSSTYSSRRSLPPTSPSDFSSDATLPVHTKHTANSTASTLTHPARGVENLAAAPPTPLLALAFIPAAIAIYITSTRYADFHHHGFDVLFGSLIGIAASTFAFRCYHMPLAQGLTAAGWAWGPRSAGRAWGVGVGTAGYVGEEGWESTVVGRRRKVGGEEKELGGRQEEGDVEMQRGLGALDSEDRTGCTAGCGA